jgi:myo-inositol-1(or 4)-monophosphatase
MTYSEIPSLVEIANRIRNAILPDYGSPDKNLVTGQSASGDANFSIDDSAEDQIEKFFTENSYPVACFTEDKALKKFCKDPRYLLIIDPIDGSRPASCGFESACISIALTKYADNPKFKDIEIACILEIKSGNLFTAERGKGNKIFVNSREVPTKLTKNTDLTRMAWAFEVCGRPSKVIFDIIHPLVDISSVTGGCYLFNSTTFGVTRILTGQLHAFVDIGARVFKRLPDSKKELTAWGNPYNLGLFSYDIAALYLIAKESGIIFTDAFGNSFDEITLFSDDKKRLFSLIAAANKNLYDKIMSIIDKQFDKIEKS